MKVTEILPTNLPELHLKKVAAYARVSTDKDDAIHSLSAQISYYNEYISGHPGWEYAGVYADNGISGTKRNRPEFQRMIADAKAGKIDMVITKSITRFARNTVVLLETIRELKGCGTDVYFEKENMHSLSHEGELMLTLLAIYAEEESRSASENQNWRIQKLHEQGKTPSGKILGYKLVNGRFEIVPEEAEIVRKIFELYLSGMGFIAIAKQLNAEGIKTRDGYEWAGTKVRAILTNEKFMGDMLLQKTYREDFRTKRRMENHGERRMYYVENSHEPIVSKETFQKVQEEIRRRSGKSHTNHNPVTDSPFSGLLTCLECGKRYHRRINHPGTKYAKVFWSCVTAHRQGKTACPSKRIPENILFQKTLDATGLKSLDGVDLKEYVEEIGTQNRTLYYRMKDGSIKIAKWEYVSRSESWTPEMREQARKAEHDRKEKKNG